METANSTAKKLEEALYELILEYDESTDPRVKDAVGKMQQAVSRLRDQGRGRPPKPMRLE